MGFRIGGFRWVEARAQEGCWEGFRVVVGMEFRFCGVLGFRQGFEFLVYVFTVYRP